MKALLLEIARWAVALAAVICLVLMFRADPISDADPVAVRAAATEQMDLSQVLEADNQMLRRLYGLDPAAYESIVLYYPATNMGAEELLIVKLASVDQAEAVRSASDARLQTQKYTFDGYGVEQTDLLTNHAAVEVRGNYVLFVVSKTADQVRQAFLDAL
jgi:hypothetical protein